MLEKLSGRRCSIIMTAFLAGALALTALSCGDDSTEPSSPGPAMAFYPTSVVFDAAPGANPAGPKAVVVTNTGGGTLTGLADTIIYGASEPSGWLAAVWDSATAPTGLTLTAASSVLPVGTYSATVRITATKATNDPKNLPVSLKVYARYGFPNEFGQVSSHGANYLLGSKITVPRASTATHLCLIAKAGGPQVRMALYSDSGGNPAHLVAATDATTLVAGRMEIPLAASVPLVAGDYWLMGVYSASANIGYSTANTAAVVKYVSHPFANALPDPFPTPNMYTGQEFNYYIRAYVP